MEQTSCAKPAGAYRRFFIILLSVCGALLILGSVTILWLWSNLRRYDETTPQAPVEEFLTLLQEDKLPDAITLARVDKTLFENDEECLSYLDSIFVNGYEETSWRKAKTDGDAVLYNIYSGDKKAMTLTVAPSGETGVFGRALYRITSAGFFTLEDITVTVPSGAFVMVNGKKADPAAAETTVLTEEYRGVDKALCPAMMTYTFSGLLRYPDISVSDDAGHTFATDQQVGSDFALTYHRTLGSEMKKQMEELTVKAGQSYARFITKKISYYGLRPLLLQGSTFCKEMSEYDNEWFSYSSNQKFENVEVFDIHYYDDDHFTADLHMDMSQKMANGLNTYDLHYRVAFVRRSGNWYVGVLSTITDAREEGMSTPEDE